MDATSELPAADGCSTSSPAVCPASDDAAVTHETSPVARLSTVVIRSACCGSVSTVSVDHSTENRSITTSPCHTGRWNKNKSSSCSASNHEVAVNDVTGSETSFTDSVPCSSTKSTFPLSSKRKKKKSSHSACTTSPTETIRPKECEFTMTTFIQDDSKNPSMPDVVHECASTTTLKAKKKRKKKRSSAAVNENTLTMKAPPCDDQSVCTTSNSSFPVSNFEQELEWCIAQLELTRSDASKMQKIDNEKYIRLLRSGKSPLPRKRQLMKTLFGDYRSKMIKEPLQQGFPPPVSICAIREKGLVSSRGRFLKKSVHKDSGTHNGASVECVSVMNKTKEVSPVFHFNFDMEA